MSRKGDQAAELLNEGNVWSDEGAAAHGHVPPGNGTHQNQAGAWGQQHQTAPGSLPFEHNNYNQDVGGRLGPAPPPGPSGPSIPSNPSAGNLVTPPPAQDGQRPKDDKHYGIFSIERYRQSFDVDTSDVIKRMLASSVFFWRSDFIEMTQDNPDLYGPFWIASTLIFVVAAVSNLVSYANFRRTHPTSTHSTGSSGQEQLWYLDTNKAVASIFIFYGYVFLVPLFFWVAFRIFKTRLSVVQTACIFGYSLAIFIPVGFLCAIPFTWLQWLIILLAFCSTAWFLARNFNSHITQAAAQAQAMLQGRLSEKALRALITLMVLIFHLGLSLALGFYFFHYARVSSSPSPSPSPTSAPHSVPTPTPKH